MHRTRPAICWKGTLARLCLITLLIVSVVGCESTPEWTYGHILDGEKMNEGEAAQARHRIELRPDDWRARLRFVGYLSMQFIRTDDPEVEERSRNELYSQVSALVELQPTMDLTDLPYRDLHHDHAEQVEILWKAHLARRPDHPAVLHNAMMFYLVLGYVEEAEPLARRGMQVRPNTSRWLESIRAYRYLEWHMAFDSFGRPKLFGPQFQAEQELAILEELKTIDNYRHAAISAAMRADALYRSGRPKEAKDAADVVMNGINDDWASLSANDAWAAHHASVVLGLIARDEKDWESAFKYLAASTAFPLGPPEFVAISHVDLRLVAAFCDDDDYRRSLAVSALKVMANKLEWFAELAGELTAKIDRGEWPTKAFLAGQGILLVHPGRMPDPTWRDWFESE